MFQTNTARLWWGQDLDPGRPITMSIRLCPIALPLPERMVACPTIPSQTVGQLSTVALMPSEHSPSTTFCLEYWRSQSRGDYRGVQEGRKQSKLRPRMSMPAPRLGWGLGRHLCVCADSVCLSSLCTGQSLLCFSPSDLFPPLALEFLAPLSTSS